MALPLYPESLSIRMIEEEFGEGRTTPISLSEFYAGGLYVRSGVTGYPKGIETLVPTIGKMSIGNFHGAVKEELLIFTESTIWTVPAGVRMVSAVIVAGGGSGGNNIRNSDESGGGGGAGGVLFQRFINVTPGDDITIIVGAGGATNSYSTYEYNCRDYCCGYEGDCGQMCSYCSTGYIYNGSNGNNSSFGPYIAYGGGYGGGGQPPYRSKYGASGGSGGGSMGYYGGAGGGGYIAGQGYPGGYGGEESYSGGGGGAGGAGRTPYGGPGRTFSWADITFTVGGGGGSGEGWWNRGGFSGGIGGGGRGSIKYGPAIAGQINTGGGGGGGSSGGRSSSGYYIGAAGGSGVVYVLIGDRP